MRRQHEGSLRMPFKIDADHTSNGRHACKQYKHSTFSNRMPVKKLKILNLKTIAPSCAVSTSCAIDPTHANVEGAGVSGGSSRGGSLTRGRLVASPEHVDVVVVFVVVVVVVVVFVVVV